MFYTIKKKKAFDPCVQLSAQLSPPSDPWLQLTHITSCTVSRNRIMVQACCPEPELTTPTPSVPLVQQKKKKKKKKKGWGPSEKPQKEKQIHLLWKILLGFQRLCVHKVSLLPSTQTQMSFTVYLAPSERSAGTTSSFSRARVLSLSVALQKVANFH